METVPSPFKSEGHPDVTLPSKAHELSSIVAMGS